MEKADKLSIGQLKEVKEILANTGVVELEEGEDSFVIFSCQKKLI